jgi:Homeodomain-like domain
MPGPSPLDRPIFPDQFLEECRSLVRRRTVPHDRRQRARLVLLLHESPGLSNVAAGALVELHAHSVQRWRRRWAGRVNRWVVEITSSVRMRRRASRPESDVTRLCRRVRDAPCEWNMSMSGAAPCSTWLRGTFSAVESWVDARTRPESTRSADWSIR